MNLPTDRRIDELVAELELPAKVAKTLKRAAARQRKGGSSRPDGFPRGRGYEGAGGPARVTVEADRHGPEESLEMTSVELVALAREREQRDSLEARLADALDALGRAVKAKLSAESHVRTLVGLVDVLENLELDLDATNELRCQAMARIGVVEAFHKRRTIGGQTWALGRWAYEFAIAADRLPTIEECRAHDAGRKVRRTIDPTKVNTAALH